MTQKALLLILIVWISQTTTAQQSWKSADYKAEKYRKVMVLAKVTDALAKRQLEDATVNSLKEKGIDALPAYSHLTEADMTDEAAFMAKMDTLKVDALITYSVKGLDMEYKNTPSAGVYVGVPVKVGIFRGSIGGNVPITSGTKTSQKVNMNAASYNRSSHEMQWSITLSGKLKSNTSKLASSFAKTTVDAIIRDQIIVP